MTTAVDCAICPTTPCRPWPILRFFQTAICPHIFNFTNNYVSLPVSAKELLGKVWLLQDHSSVLGMQVALNPNLQPTWAWLASLLDGQVLTHHPRLSPELFTCVNGQLYRLLETVHKKALNAFRQHRDMVHMKGTNRLQTDIETDYLIQFIQQALTAFRQT